MTLPQKATSPGLMGHLGGPMKISNLESPLEEEIKIAFLRHPSFNGMIPGAI